MVTRLEIHKLALRELMRQWYDECSPTVGETLKNPKMKRLQKDIQYVCERIVDLENEYHDNMYHGVVYGKDAQLARVKRIKGVR